MSQATTKGENTMERKAMAALLATRMLTAEGATIELVLVRPDFERPTIVAVGIPPQNAVEFSEVDRAGNAMRGRESLLLGCRVLWPAPPADLEHLWQRRA